MNRAFLVIIIPAALVLTAYFLLAAYAGVQLTYARAIAVWLDSASQFIW
jgi:hypothetical protein